MQPTKDYAQTNEQQLFLEVRGSNEAGLRLYEKWGFLEVGRRKGYYPAVAGREDAIVMRRALADIEKSGQ